MIWGVQEGQIDDVLPRIRPQLENIADRSTSRWMADEIEAEARAKSVQIWVCNDFQAVALTRVWRDAVSIVACTGEDRADWADELEAEIAAWAKWMGKSHLIIDGRPGWSPWLRGKGYRETHREMTRVL